MCQCLKLKKAFETLWLHSNKGPLRDFDPYLSPYFMAKRIILHSSVLLEFSFIPHKSIENRISYKDYELFKFKSFFENLIANMSRIK